MEAAVCAVVVLSRFLKLSLVDINNRQSIRDIFRLSKVILEYVFTAQHSTWEVVKVT